MDRALRENRIMFHLTSAARPIGSNDYSEDRDRMDHVVLHEARIATDYRQHLADDEALARSQERRIRFSLGRRATTVPEVIACCA